MKRIFDFFIAVCAIIALSPALVVVALLIRWKLGTPVLFKQVRPGLNGQPFEMVKFRTMRDAVGKDGNPLPDSERLTSFGRSLRATSLDELPELWNVLKGDMSLVGPRPLLVDYLPYYTEQESIRHKCLPGLTGYAQINGRNATTWKRRFELDAFYVDNKNFIMDLKILFATIKIVVLKIGISHEDSATMPSFIEYAKTRNEK